MSHANVYTGFIIMRSKCKTVLMVYTTCLHLEWFSLYDPLIEGLNKRHELNDTTM